MSQKHLHRADASFADGVWTRIDEAALGAAKAHMSGRRLLYVDGPHGLGLKAIPGPERPVGKPGEDEPALAASESTPVVLLRAGFRLSAADIAAFEQTGLPMDLGAAVAAGRACARQEDRLVLHGVSELGVSGLLTAKGVLSAKLGDWTEVGAAAEDLMAAVTGLDEAGFHGPYTLGLAPASYNRLFRRYKQGNQTELEHIQTLITDGVVKVPAMASGGVLLASGRQYASIVLGQDLAVGFVGPTAEGYEFTVSESLALRLAVPEAVCVLK